MTLKEIIAKFKERRENNPRYQETMKKIKELASQRKAKQEDNNANN